MKKHNSLHLVAVLTLGISMAGINALRACTDFVVNTRDGVTVCGRSMEWALDMESRVSAHPRGQNRHSTAPGGGNGLSWISKYGFVFINIYGLDTAMDGLNEAGLSVGFLWLPGTKYQTVGAGEENKAVNIMDLGAWLLGNFATVDEVKSAVPQIHVWGKELPQLKAVPTLHAAVHDAGGKNLVIEYVDGELRLHDNKNGVLTNAPNFDWHMTNLTNFVNLTNLNAPVTWRGQTINGSGMLGIPGDWTPPSRFVRATVFTRFAEPPRNAVEGVNLALHILNTVDIPTGEVKSIEHGTVRRDYTQWIAVKDLKNKVVYFRSYGNLNLRAVDLKKLDFAPGEKLKSIAIAGGEWATDVSGQLD